MAANPLAPARRTPRRFYLSPINRRRLENFKANKRGYWSFWIFLFFFVLSLFSEFIANDRPLLVVYKGEILVPILHDYPEEKFGGFLAQTDYRDAVIAKEIAEHGFMIWPPIRYSYKTINRQLPVPAPSPPTWMLSEAQCRAAAKRFDKGQPNGDCRDIEWNWLGTDDQGRDVLARLLYGFRLSLLFGLTLAGISSVVGIAAGAVQGYFGGWTDLIFQRFIEIWSSLPHLYLLIIISSII
ncbi:MAG: ABC transporter permease, partial [Methylocella sp.]